MQQVEATLPTVAECNDADIQAVTMGDWYMPKDRAAITAENITYHGCFVDRHSPSYGLFGLETTEQIIAHATGCLDTQSSQFCCIPKPVVGQV
eukprot:SAG11_NODE_25076_length_364_cov_0.588679_1_plen_92_part_01